MPQVVAALIAAFGALVVALLTRVPNGRKRVSLMLDEAALLNTFPTNHPTRALLEERLIREIDAYCVDLSSGIPQARPDRLLKRMTWLLPLVVAFSIIETWVMTSPEIQGVGWRVWELRGWALFNFATLIGSVFILVYLGVESIAAFRAARSRIAVRDALTFLEGHPLGSSLEFREAADRIYTKALSAYPGLRDNPKYKVRPLLVPEVATSQPGSDPEKLANSPDSAGGGI